MSKISFQEFSNEFIKDLQIEEQIDLSIPLKEINQYDSMGKITISLTIESHFGFQICYEVLDKIETIEALYNYCIENCKE